MELFELFNKVLAQTLLLWLLSGLFSTESREEDIHEPCSFPQTLRTTEWPWKILSSDPSDKIFHLYRRVTFRDHDMRVDYMRMRYSEEIATSYTYSCVKQLQNNKFLVSREDEMNEGKYTCIQFVYRGINVYQLKFGPLEKKRSNSLCNNDKLELLDAPMVYYHTVGGYWDERRNINSSYKICPLTGGYLVKWYDEDGHLGCNSTESVEPLKFENECTNMEGIRFHSFNRECPLPDQRLERPHYCFASWREHRYTFMLLWQRNDDFDMPCIRIDSSASGGARVTAHIFLDGVCDSSSTVTRSLSYRKLELEKLIVPDMCSNENSLCTDHEAVPSCTSESAAICKNYCKVCQTPLPWADETFPETLQGKWQQLGVHKKYSIVEFKQGLLTYPSRFQTYLLTSKSMCLKGGTMGARTKEYTLLSTYNNGCSPRATIAIIASRSKSIISIHFSQAMVARVNTELDIKHNHWKITNDYKWWCADISLDAESNPRNSMYRYWYHIWTNLIRVENVHETVPCDFGVPSKTQTFSMRTGNNDICSGQIHEAEGDRFNVDIFGSCSKGGDTGTTFYTKDIFVDTTVSVQATTRHFCLASFQDNYKNQFIITQSQDTMSEVNITLLCWFISDNGRIVYWLPIGNCDTSTELLIMNRKVTPLATLYFDSSPTCCASYLCYLVLTLYWTLQYISL